MTVKYSSGTSFLNFLSSYIKNPDYHPPFYPAIVYILKALNLSSDWWLKMPSVFFGSACVPLVYLLGKKSFNKESALFAALLMAFSGANIYYSQEIRYSASLVFWILLITYLCYSLESIPKKFQIFTLTSVGLILAYTHYTGTVIALSSLIFFSLKDLDIKKGFPYFVSFLLVMIGFIPWLKIVEKQSLSWSIYRAYNQSPNLFIYFFKMFNFSFIYETYWLGMPSIIQPLYLQFFFYLFLFVIVLCKAIQKKSTQVTEALKRLDLIYFLTITFGPIIVFFVHDYYSTQKYFYEKALLFTLPFLYLLFTTYIFSIFHTHKRRIAIISFFSLFLLFQPLINQNYYHSIFKTEFKQMSQFIIDNNHHIPVIVTCGDPAWYDYYFQKQNIQAIYSNTNINTVLHDFKSNEFWLVNAHCQAPLEEQALLNNLTIIKSFPSHTLANAYLVKSR